MRPSLATLLIAVSLVLVTPTDAGVAPSIGASGVTNAPKTKAAQDVPAVPAARPVPFRGTIKSVDKKAGTLTVGTRTFSLAATCKIMRGEKAATIAEAVPGEWVTGSYRKQGGGKLVATSVYLGGKNPQPNSPSPKK